MTLIKYWLDDPFNKVIHFYCLCVTMTAIRRKSTARSTHSNACWFTAKWLTEPDKLAKQTMNSCVLSRPRQRTGKGSQHALKHSTFQIRMLYLGEGICLFIIPQKCSKSLANSRWHVDEGMEGLAGLLSPLQNLLRTWAGGTPTWAGCPYCSSRANSRPVAKS